VAQLPNQGIIIPCSDKSNPLTNTICGGSEEGLLSRLSPSITYPGHTGHGIAQYRDLHPSTDLPKRVTTRSGTQLREAPADSPSRNALQKTPKASNRKHSPCSRLCPWGEETRGPNETPTTDAESVRPPLEHRAPGSQNCRHPRKPRCSGSQSITHPLCETYHGRKGGINQGQHFPNF